MRTGGLCGKWWWRVFEGRCETLLDDGAMELMVCEVDVSVRACVMSCFNLALGGKVQRESENKILEVTNFAC